MSDAAKFYGSLRQMSRRVKADAHTRMLIEGKQAVSAKKIRKVRDNSAIVRKGWLKRKRG